MTRKLKHVLRGVVEKMVWAVLQCQLTLAYRLWGIEGVNRILLACNSAYVGKLLIRFGAVVAADHDLHSPLVIHNAERDYANLTIGGHCHMGKGVFLDLRDAIAIGDHVTISMRAMVLTHMDVGHSPLRDEEFPTRESPVVIKRGAYIGAGAIILQGVTVGECAVVGAGAVVTEDIPDHSVAVGVPARVIRSFKTCATPGGSALE